MRRTRTGTLRLERRSRAEWRALSRHSRPWRLRLLRPHWLRRQRARPANHSRCRRTWRRGIRRPRCAGRTGSRRTSRASTCAACGCRRFRGCGCSRLHEPRLRHGRTLGRRQRTCRLWDLSWFLDPKSQRRRNEASARMRRGRSAWCVGNGIGRRCCLFGLRDGCRFLSWRRYLDRDRRSFFDDRRGRLLDGRLGKERLGGRFNRQLASLRRTSLFRGRQRRDRLDDFDEPGRTEHRCRGFRRLCLFRGWSLLSTLRWGRMLGEHVAARQ